MKKIGNILWGIVLIAIGLILTLNALGITDINIFFRGWWTLFIIVPSVIELIRSENKGWSFIWLVVGIVLLLSSHGFLEFAIIAKLIFPFILVVIGFNLLFLDFFKKKTSEKFQKASEITGEEEEFCATFAEVEGDYEEREFHGAKLDAIFGTTKLNLKKAIIKHDEVIHASAIFGSVDIIVPPNVNVRVQSTPIFGGVTNKVKANYDENLPTIYVKSFCMFGGVEIR